MAHEQPGGHRESAHPEPRTGIGAEAEELAVWLRELTAGLTLRDLASRFPYERNQWSEFRKGRKLIPSWLLDDLVRELTPGGPQARQLKQLRGRELLQAAERAAAIHHASRAQKTSEATSAELQLRLDDARRGQLMAQEALMGLTHLVHVFVRMVTDLRQRCADLEEEVREARGDQEKLELQEQLDEFARYRAEAEARLTAARRERDEAEELRIAAQQLAEQHRLAYERLRHTTPQEEHSDYDERTHRRRATAELPQPWEYERVMEAADAQLDTHRARISSIREQIGVPEPEEPGTPVVVPGHVVRDAAADSADTPGRAVLGADTDSGDGARPAGAATSAGPASAPAPARRRKRTRAVLVGTGFLVLLGVGGWLVGAALPPTDSEVLADMKTLRIGVKDGQPGLSEKKNGKWIGFDVRFAEELARKMGFSLARGNLEFVPTETNNRESDLIRGKVDLVVGSYTITDDRKKKVDFAGSYYNSGQTIMMRSKASGGISLADQLPEGARVCTARKSTSEKRMKKEFGKKYTILTEVNYNACVEGLTGKDPKYDAVTTDEEILYGLRKNNNKPADLKIIRDSIGDEEPYGIGMKKGNPEFHALVCEKMGEVIEEDWEEIYRATLHDLGPKRPPLPADWEDECPSGGLKGPWGDLW